MTTIPVFNHRQRWTYRGLLALWTAGAGAFWQFWFQASHVISPGLFVITTIVIGYSMLMPAYFFFFLGRMRRPHPALRPPAGLRVAIATTFVPSSESISILRRTLVAMIEQTNDVVRHDVWVLDEGRSVDCQAMCRQLGVRYFSRQGIERYQSPVWPFRRKTKSGNYNAWLDVHGHEYDVLIQMDTDHVPQPGYMAEMLRPFGDPDIQYVAAPSIVSANATASWVVKARYETEATLHGVLQMGYADGYAPLIIGSHAAFRVSALRAIGGFQHTLAEDHHNTLRLNATGHRGVFAPDAIAVGDGAESFEEAMTQEYQWARALTQILLRFLRPDWKGLPWRMRCQFLFAQTWYPLFAVTQTVGFAMAPVALMTGQPWVRVSLGAFWAFYGFNAIVGLLAVAWIRRQGWLRPRNSRLLTFGMIGLLMARWPFVLWAVIDAVISTTMRRESSFKVTQKGKKNERRLSARATLPYLFLVAGSIVALFIHSPAKVEGYRTLTIISVFAYVVFLCAITIRNHRENRRIVTVRRAWKMHAPAYGVVAIMGLTACMIARPVSSPVTHSLSPVHASPVLIAPATNRLLLGAYDPHGALNPRDSIDLEEVFVQWKPSIHAELADDLAQIISRKRVPVVTVEPYPWGINGLGQSTLLADITAGRYDSAIEGISTAVADSGSVMYIRFAQEMDASFYPWAGQPGAYVAAYRHFVAVTRQHTTNVRWIWSPIGTPDIESYYPGSDVVDYLSGTILSATDWNPSAAPAQFKGFVTGTWLADLSVRFGKPMILCEVGASMPEPAKTEWIKTIVDDGPYPGVAGLVYFNDQEPVHPGQSAGIARPDWRLTAIQADILFGRPPSPAKGGATR